jgi:DNA-directed RNA polymerase omega subunit
MKYYSVEDFRGKVDSLYRLVLLGSRRANQIARTESRPLIATHSKKPTVIALEEVLSGKVSYSTGELDEESYLE